MIIRKLSDKDFASAEKLMFRSFYRCIINEYTDEGIERFRDLTSAMSLAMNTFDGSMVIYGAFDKDSLLGVIGKKGNNYINLFFVDPDHIGRGIGRKLFDHFMRYRDKTQDVTVNSSDYAVDIYKHFGFAVSGKRVSDGTNCYTPMILKATED